MASAVATLAGLIALSFLMPRGFLIVSGASMLGLAAWFVFWAPAPCLATTREGTRCRNNSKGLIGGCYLVSHQSQTLLARLRPVEGLPSPRTVDIAKTTITVMGSIGSFVGGAFAVIAFFVGGR